MYYPMDDAAGVGHFTDHSGNGFDTDTSLSAYITQTSGLIQTSSDTAAFAGSGPNNMFNHKSGVTIPATPNALTVMGWIQTTSAPATSCMIGIASGATTIFMQFLLDLGKPRFQVYDNTNTFHQISGPTSVADAGRHFLVGVFDGSNLFLYVDAVQVASLAGAFTRKSGSYDPVLGYASHTSASALNGTLDEVAVFLSAIAPADITNLYNLATST